MTKFFCDICGAEITKHNTTKGALFTSLRHVLKKTLLSIRVTLEWQNEEEDDITCKYCVLDALRKLDDRPQEAPDTLKPWEPGPVDPPTNP